MAGTRAQKLCSWDTIKYELLRAAHSWPPFSGTAWAALLIIARFGVNLCVLALIIRPSILAFQRNSTRQHYDTIEIIALGAENCVCVFAIVNDRRKVRGVRHQLLYVQIFVTRRSCSPPRGEQGERVLCASATNASDVAL